MRNEICARCPLGRETINGRWCTSLGLLVEYTAAPPCRPVENSPEDTGNPENRHS